MLNPGIALNVAAHFFLSTPYLLKKTSSFTYCANTHSNITWWKDLENDHSSSLSLKPSNLELLVNQFNNATPENSSNPEKTSSSKYYDIVELPHKNKSLSLFHII